MSGEPIIRISITRPVDSKTLYGWPISIIQEMLKLRDMMHLYDRGDNHILRYVLSPGADDIFQQEIDRLPSVRHLAAEPNHRMAFGHKLWCDRDLKDVTVVIEISSGK